MAEDVFENAGIAAEFIRSQTSVEPRIAVVLGSGLGSFAEAVENGVAIPYAAIPHFSASTVEGHSGRLLLGRVAGVPVAVMQGRVHGYEGYSPLQVTFPVRVLGSLGVKTIVFTNASGGVRLDLKPGQLVLLSDHINLTGLNPLSGPNDSRLGPRFLDVSEAYSKRLRGVAKTTAEGQGFELAEGVYLCVSGPTFETPAEIRAFRILGADLVGMSTVHEVIAARHMGLQVLGISCVTNMAAGILDRPLSHHEVLEAGARVQAQMTRFLTALLPRIDR
ncbi:MAG TPA: purine-nucleoside phosphorylase [Acidobacteriaceae bacterium]